MTKPPQSMIDDLYKDGWIYMGSNHFLYHDRYNTTGNPEVLCLAVDLDEPYVMLLLYEFDCANSRYMTIAYKDWNNSLYMESEHYLYPHARKWIYPFYKTTESAMLNAVCSKFATKSDQKLNNIPKPQWPEYNWNHSEYFVFKDYGKKGLKNKQGIVLLPAIYDEIYFPFENRPFMVRKDDKFGFVDITGKIVLPVIYEYVNNFDYDGDRAHVVKDGKHGYIDKNGKIIIPLIYDNADMAFHKKRALVKKNGKYGMIDIYGKEVLPFIYDYAYSLADGSQLIKAEIGPKCFYIDRDGKYIKDCD